MDEPRSPRLTVDSITLDATGRLLLVRRGRPPFSGQWALPGGFVEYGETVEAACVRETLEETGVEVQIEKLCGVYSKPGRDPRGHTVSVVFRCRPVAGKATEGPGVPAGGDDASEARWIGPEELKGIALAFDHAEIVSDQVRP